jgi:hypothetical protein
MRDFQTDQLYGSILFESGDKDGDKKLEPYELHGALMSKGIVVPLPSLLSLFAAADTDNNGFLTLEEFSNYLVNLPSEPSKVDYFLSLLSNVDFWLAIVLALGGLFFFIPEFPNLFPLLPGVEVRNIYLAGSICYFVSGMKYNIRRPLSVFREKSAQENAVVNMQEKVLKNAADFSEGLDQTNPNVLATYIDKAVFGDEFPTTMTKTDLELFLLKEASIANRGVVNAIFSFVDVDGGGTISREELHFFVEEFNPRQSLLDHLRFMTAVCFKEISWSFGVVFSSASVLSISNNISRRFGGPLWVAALTVSMVISYIYVIGCLAFVAEAYEWIRDKFDLEEEVRGTLRKWLAESNNEIKSSNEATFNKTDLNALLEKGTIFIPRSNLDSIFAQIDTDGSDRISLAELKQFAESERKRMPTIFTWCIKDLYLMTNFLWSIGSANYVVGAYDIAPVVNYKIGGSIFLIGGLNLLYNFVRKGYAQLEYTQFLNNAILKLADKSKDLEDAKEKWAEDG